MFNDFKKHKILRVLDEHWKEGEAKTGGGREVTEIGRALTVNEVSKRTKIGLQKVEDLCNSLSTSYHVKMACYDKNKKAHKFIITQLGQSAFTDWLYPKQFGKSVGALITLFVAVVSLLWNVFSSQKLKSLDARLDSLEPKQQATPSKK